MPSSAHDYSHSKTIDDVAALMRYLDLTEPSCGLLGQRARGERGATGGHRAS